ncbi:TIGR03089 family protein [Georgenia sp. SYP-B2076]|uniref:TIGR03089 family protein n=1 Tax=Georgenia sp. SYP-B2076 TaxID=2495881 RepID=UPI000F8D5B50|nr:TIGR03089 family protein [Georgenia sp. SYP-B2076]
MTFPATLPGQLLDTFLSSGASSPRLTWYGVGGERTELSGRVLANWVTKAANLLVEEADAEPGTKVVLDLPVHWRALVWALGAWTTGAQLVLPGAEDVEDDVAVVVTTHPDQAPGAGAADLVLAVALPALAMRWDGADLPSGVVDAAAELMTYGDRLGYVSEPEDDDLALTSDELEATFGELASWSAGSGELGEQEVEDNDDVTEIRVLVSPTSMEKLLEQALAVWQARGSLVLAEPGTPADALERIAEEERVELRW